MKDIQRGMGRTTTTTTHLVYRCRRVASRQVSTDSSACSTLWYNNKACNKPVLSSITGIVGVGMDGIPIYGPWDENGRQLTQQDLDECGGMEDGTGRYKYHLTSDPPYLMNCVKGEVRR